MQPTRRLAELTAFVTFLLLLLGNVVWGTGSSLACPDWPTCHGTLLPDMVGGVLYEHAHRILGATVGLLTIAMATSARCSKQPPRVRIAAYAAVAIVMLQGVLGGLTVLLRLPAVVSVAHLTTAMAFFSLLLFIATFADVSQAPVRSAARGSLLVWLAYAITFLQIVLGGVVRHSGAAAACTDLPLCNGGLVLSGSGQAIHMGHRIFALSVAVLLVAVAVHTHRSKDVSARVRFHAWVGVFLIGVQIVLGALTVSTGLDLVIVTAHLGAAALLLGNLLLFGLALGPAQCISRDGSSSAVASRSPSLAIR